MITINTHRRDRRPRRPERTRARLLQAAFRQIYRCGFQKADLAAILAQAGVTKGALYHHFRSKDALGQAVIEHVIARLTHEKWLEPLQTADDPIEALIGIVRGTSLRATDVRGGCPLNNLAQEMSPLDERFRQRLAQVFEDWQAGIANALEAGRLRGLVRREVNPKDAATFIVAVYEGYVSLAKNSLDARVLEAGVRHLVSYLTALRPGTEGDESAFDSPPGTRSRRASSRKGRVT
jgi:AcrR family transcriptional regulator